MLTGCNRPPQRAGAGTASARARNRRWPPRRWQRRDPRRPGASSSAAGTLHHSIGRCWRRDSETRRGRDRQSPARASSASIFFTAAWAPPSRSSSTRCTGAGSSSARSSCRSIAVLSSFCKVQPFRCSHCSSSRYLVDTGNGAAGDLGELGIDLRCRCLGNLAGSLGEGAVNTEAALVDDGAQLPDRLLSRRQRRQPPVDLTLDLHILPAIFTQPIESLRIVEPIDTSRVFIFVRDGAASTSDASAAHRPHLCGW